MDCTNTHIESVYFESPDIKCLDPLETKWQDDDYYLQKDPLLDITSFLWDEANQNEDGLLCMFDETTPVKACGDFNYRVSDIDENMSKRPEECLDSLQLERRRMLQFNSCVTDPCLHNEQNPSSSMKPKDGNASMEDTIPTNMEYVTSFSEDDRHTFGFDGLDQSPERFLATCFEDNQIHYNCDEMNGSGGSDDRVEISEVSNKQPVMQTDMLPEHVSPASRTIFKGRGTCMRTPTKLASSIAYPFALIKPSGVGGDITLKDINQLICTPPVRSKHKEGKEILSSYPTSAFSGKPVVKKTRIHTEGGKGSITITRTKG